MGGSRWRLGFSLGSILFSSVSHPNIIYGRAFFVGSPPNDPYIPYLGRYLPSGTTELSVILFGRSRVWYRRPSGFSPLKAS